MFKNNLFLCIYSISFNYSSTSYLVERKYLERMGTFSEWSVIYRDLSDTSIRIKEFDAEKDSLYRVRAENEYGLSEPSMCITFYGKPGCSKYCLEL